MQIVEVDKKKFETHNFLEKIIRVFTVPLLNSIPCSFTRMILAGTSKDGMVVVKRGGSTRALEVMYTRYERKLLSRGIFQGAADLFWYNCLSQPKAVRNRLKIVEEKLEEEILNLFYNKKKQNINILSVAGGSARGVIKTICEFNNNHKGCNINVVNIDKSEDAINLGKELSKKFGVNDNLKWIKDDAGTIRNYLKNNSMDIVEMVGLLDYFNDEKGSEIFKQIYSVLEKDGMFITANIRPNKEMPFISKVWPKMIYRDPEDLASLLNNAGFPLDRTKIFVEPLKTHIIAVTKK